MNTTILTCAAVAAGFWAVTIPAGSMAHGSDDPPPHVLRAQAFALDISGEREAPAGLTDAIAADLEALYAHAPEFASLRAYVPWIDIAPAILAFAEDGVAVKAMIAEVTEAIPLLTPTRSDEDRRRHPRRWEPFRMPLGYHPGRIAEEAAALPAVASAGMNQWFGSGNYAAYEPDEERYSFHYGWGDCPSGCIARRAYRFRVVDGEPRFESAHGNMVIPFRVDLVGTVPLRAGDSIRLAGGALPTAELQWRRNGVPIGAPGGELVLESLGPEDGATYQLRATDRFTGETADGFPIDLIVMGPEFDWGHVSEIVSHGWEGVHRDWFGDHPAFGPFLAEAYPWVQLYWHGWWYEYAAGPDGDRFVYDSELGWIWTAADFYPFLYRFADGGSWLYYSQAASNTQQRRFYDFEAASWRTVPRSR